MGFVMGYMTEDIWPVPSFPAEAIRFPLIISARHWRALAVRPNAVLGSWSFLPAMRSHLSVVTLDKTQRVDGDNAVASCIGAAAHLVASRCAALGCLIAITDARFSHC